MRGGRFTPCAGEVVRRGRECILNLVLFGCSLHGVCVALDPTVSSADRSAHGLLPLVLCLMLSAYVGLRYQVARRGARGISSPGADMLFITYRTYSTTMCLLFSFVSSAKLLLLLLLVEILIISDPVYCFIYYIFTLVFSYFIGLVFSYSIGYGPLTRSRSGRRAAIRIAARNRKRERVDCARGRARNSELCRKMLCAMASTFLLMVYVVARRHDYSWPLVVCTCSIILLCTKRPPRHPGGAHPRGVDITSFCDTDFCDDKAPSISVLKARIADLEESLENQCSAMICHSKEDATQNIDCSATLQSEMMLSTQEISTLEITAVTSTSFPGIAKEGNSSLNLSVSDTKVLSITDAIGEKAALDNSKPKSAYGNSIVHRDKYVLYEFEVGPNFDMGTVEVGEFFTLGSFEELSPMGGESVEGHEAPQESYIDIKCKTRRRPRLPPQAGG